MCLRQRSSGGRSQTSDHVSKIFTSGQTWVSPDDSWSERHRGCPRIASESCAHQDSCSLFDLLRCGFCGKRTGDRLTVYGHDASRESASTIRGICGHLSTASAFVIVSGRKWLLEWFVHGENIIIENNILSIISFVHQASGEFCRVPPILTQSRSSDSL
jgi:hypothetical protein